MHEIDYRNFEGLTKEEKYRQIIPQIESLVNGENNLIANLANITSALKFAFSDFSWTGFYLADDINSGNLVLGPFQGRTACTRIPAGKGVCGTAAREKRTIIVRDVAEFPGHIACDSGSRSEIVVPIIKEDKVPGVLDVDSYEYSAFDDTDKKFLEELIEKVKHIF